MFFAAGEILHRRAVALVRERPQIHLQAFQAELNAGFVRALPQDGVRFRMCDKPFEGIGRAWTSNQQIEIADRVLPAAQASGRGNLFDTAGFREIRDQLVRHLLPEAQQKPSRPLPVLRDRLEHFFFQLGAHARQLPQFLLLADALQIVDRRHLEMLINQCDAFGAEALDF